MGKRIYRIAIRRFAELLLIEIILSALVTLLNIYGFLSTQQQLLTGLFVVSLIYVGINIFLMRNSFYFLRREWAYYISNYVAYFIFAAINLIMCKAGGAIYTWLFAITKTFVYTRYEFSMFISACLCHVIMIVVIPLSTIGIDWSKI